MEHIALTVEDRVATVRFNRPDALNAFTDTMETELLEVLDAVDADYVVFTDANVATQGAINMGLILLATYEPAQCASFCTQTSGCAAVLLICTLREILVWIRMGLAVLTLLA
mgnify:CR=1 FL=1